jgi:ABC-type multidrug transport system fused ATPase/permease subunit
MQKNVSVGKTNKPDPFLPRILRQGRNYATLVGWLLYHAFKGRTWKLVVATGLSLLHLSSQGAAIYVIYWYGRAMEGTGLGKIPVLNIQLNLKDQPEWLWAIVAISTGFFVLSALLLYLSRKQILDIVEESYARNLEQLVLLSLRVPDPRVPLATHIFQDHGLGGITTGYRRGAFTAINFANAATAIIGGLGAAFFLFRIDLPLTLVITGSAALAALLLYPLTLRAVKSAKDAEKAQAAMRVEVRKLNEDPRAEQSTTSLDTADEVARSFATRRRVLTELVFATEIGVTLLLGIVIYYMASEALAGRQQWAIFIAYVGALRMTLRGAALAIRAFASVSRYYPQIVRYCLFVKGMQKLDLTPLAHVHRGNRVMLGVLPNGQDVVVEAGDCLATLAGGQTREPMFALVGAKLLSGDPVGTVIIDPDDVRQSPAGIALVPSQRLDTDCERLTTLLADPLKDKVTLIVYSNADKAGSFGERQVLTVEDGELKRFAPLGTEEGELVLKEFAANAAARRKMTVAEEDDEEDDM